MKINANAAVLFQNTPQIFSQTHQQTPEMDDSSAIPWNQPAATVDISQEGMDKLFSDANQKSYLSLEDRVQLEETGILADVEMEEETQEVSSKKLPIGMRTFNELKRCVKEDEVLSEYEQDQLIVHLENDIYTQYKFNKNYKLDPENDEEDKKLLDKELANDRMFRLRTLHDLEEAMEKEKEANEEKEKSASTAKDAAEIAERAGEVKIITDSLEYEEEAAEDENHKTENDVKNREAMEDTDLTENHMAVQKEKDTQTQFQTPEFRKTEEKKVSVSADGMHTWKRASRNHEKNNDNMDALHDRRKQAIQEEKKNAELLDTAYLQTMDYFRSGEATLKEQVDLSEKFSANAKIFMQNREVNRFRKFLYNETITDIRLGRIADRTLPNALQALKAETQSEQDMTQGIGQTLASESVRDALKDLQQSDEKGSVDVYESRKVNEEEEEQKIHASRYDKNGKDKLDIMNSPYIFGPEKAKAERKKMEANVTVQAAMSFS